MKITVHLHGSLRAFADGTSEHKVDARTVNEALGTLAEKYTSLRERIFDDKGAVRPFVNVYLNDSRVAKADEAVKDDDVVTLIPAIAGG